MPIKFDTINRQKSTLYKSLDEHLSHIQPKKSKMESYSLSIDLDSEHKAVVQFKLVFNRRIPMYLEAFELAEDYGIILQSAHLESQFVELLVGGLNRRPQFAGMTDNQIFENIALPTDFVTRGLFRTIEKNIGSDFLIAFAKIDTVFSKRKAFIRNLFHQITGKNMNISID